ncbi:MAG: NAD-dependent deacetylase [Opitutae bacterium]|nr:NAD-dependent deacetylase [Opitutae bacterium]
MNEQERSDVQSVAEAFSHAKALLIGAGAGMGADSGMPDFRGTSGFWKAYPPLAKLGIQFEEMANPRWFREDPQLAWGFYGHRLNLYRKTDPHFGFSLLLKWINEQNLSPFVFTSNVDGHFQQSGFPQHAVNECHGSLMHLQCVDQCGQAIWPVPPDLRVEIDEGTLHAIDPLPACPGCGGLARPNILMFSDWEWDPARTNEQGTRLNEWLEENGDSNLCIIELGAGPSIPTVRKTCEEAWKSSGGTFLRINPRDPQVPEGAFSLARGAEDALRAIEEIRIAG